MSPPECDPAFYWLVQDGELIGLSRGYVDDLLRSASPEFVATSKKTNERLETGADESVPRAFSGLSVERDRKSSLEQREKFYVEKLQKLPLYSNFTELRSMRMIFAWLANTRPDCQF